MKQSYLILSLTLTFILITSCGKSSNNQDTPTSNSQMRLSVSATQSVPGRLAENLEEIPDFCMASRIASKNTAIKQTGLFRLSCVRPTFWDQRLSNEY